MSLSTAFNSAMTGITAASRQTSVVSDNLANALTEGYHRRSVDLASGRYGGVSIVSVDRAADPAVQKSVRAAEASFNAATVTSTFQTRIADLVGEVNDDYSLPARLTDFEAALIEATSLPESDARLNDLAMQGEELAKAINEVAGGIETLRNSSERSIDNMVTTVNESLQRLEDLNKQILTAQIRGNDTVALQDQRDNLISEVNSIIPTNVYERDMGMVALYTTSGIKLFDGSAAELSFDRRPLVTPHMTQANGLLSGLEIDGRAVSTAINGPIGGGQLAAHFHVRDVAAVEAQEDMDALAGDLISRFQDPAVDPTLGATDVGLFTNNGGFYDDTTDLVDISSRITFNATVALSGAGETWRLRDGLNAAGVGMRGDTTILNNYADALNTARAVTSSGLGSGSYDAFDIASNLLTHFTQEVSWGEQELAYSSTVYQDMQARAAEEGVDTDAELQNLMLLETIYGANARLLQAVDEMLDQIMRL